MEYFVITYTRGDSQRALYFDVTAESEGEAIEVWEDYTDRLDDICEFVSIRQED